MYDEEQCDDLSNCYFNEQIIISLATADVALQTTTRVYNIHPEPAPNAKPTLQFQPAAGHSKVKRDQNYNAALPGAKGS